MLKASLLKRFSVIMPESDTNVLRQGRKGNVCACVCVQYTLCLSVCLRVSNMLSKTRLTRYLFLESDTHSHNELRQN